MGVSLGSAVGDLISNYEDGKQKQAAIQRQVQQQTLQNAIEQQRADDAHQAALGQQQAQQGSLALTLANLTNQGATTQAPQAAPPPIQTGMMGGGASPALPSASDATPPSTDLGMVGGQHLFLPGATSAPQKRQQRIQAITDDFASNFGRNITPAQAAMYADNPTEYDTAIRLAQTANKPNAAELADTKNQQEFGTFQALFPNRPEAKTYNAKTDYAKLGTGLMEQAKAQAAGGGHYTFPVGTDAEGKPVIMRANTTTGEIAPTNQAGKGSAQSGSAQAQQARMMAAVSEARLADQRMRTYEDGLLSGHTTISPLEQMGGSLMTNLSGAHTVGGAGTQAVSEAALNANDPAYAQYLRDAATIGRAEQMMSPRGGNETMVRANALLSRAGTGAQRATIDASRMARQALFGQAGGIEQTLSPAQSQKLSAGVKSIQSGSTTGTQKIDPADFAKLSPDDQEYFRKQGRAPE